MAAGVRVREDGRADGWVLSGCWEAAPLRSAPCVPEHSIVGQFALDDQIVAEWVSDPGASFTVAGGKGLEVLFRVDQAPADPYT